MKKYRATKMANGGKNPIVPDKRMPNKVMMSGSQDTTTTPPTVKVQGATVVAKKGEGIKTQGFGTSDYLQKRDSLMTAGVSDFMKGKPKSYKISDAERSNIKDKVRAELIKGGQQFYAPVFKETGVRLTPAQIADKKRLEEAERRKSGSGYGTTYSEKYK
jgi:hypothetical protein